MRTNPPATIRPIVVVLVSVLLLETLVAGIWISSLNEDRTNLLRICGDSWPRLGSRTMLMGEDALAGDDVLYRTHNSHAQSESYILQYCPLTEDESRLRQELSCVLMYGAFIDPLLWENRSALDFFGLALWDVGDPIYSGHPAGEALALTLTLIADMRAMGFPICY